MTALALCPSPLQAAATPSLLTEAGRRQAAMRLGARWKRAIERSAELGYVAHACAELGIHRTAFYRIWRAFRRGGDKALYDSAVRSVERSPALQQELEDAVLAETERHPDWGRQRIAKALRGRGLDVSARRVWCVWKRRGLLKPERAPTGPHPAC